MGIHKGQNKGSLNGNWQGGGVYLICKECGKSFHTLRKYQYKANFCNRSCWTIYKNKHKIWTQEEKDKISIANKGRLEGAKNPNYGCAKSHFVCNYCQKEFELPNSKLMKQTGKFCSIICKNYYLRDNKISKIQDRIHRNMRRSILHYIHNGKGGTSWEFILGYTTKDLMIHLESKFKEGMTWENYGGDGWQIDHKKPVSSFVFESIHDDQFLDCWDISNLQPLWRKENLVKGGFKRLKILTPIKYVEV